MTKTNPLQVSYLFQGQSRLRGSKESEDPGRISQEL